MASIDNSQFSNNVYGTTEIFVVSNNDWEISVTNRILWNPNRIDVTEFSNMNKGKWTIVATHPDGDVYFGMVSMVKSPLDVEDPSNGIWNDLICRSWGGYAQENTTAWVNIYGHGYELHRLE